MIGKDYVTHVAQDVEKVNAFAKAFLRAIGERTDEYRGWDVRDGSFVATCWLHECGCEDAYWFPVAWLDLPLDEIVRRWREEMGKPYGQRVVGNE